MYKDEYKVIGVMSGTSLDGIDMAIVKFKFKNDKWSFEIEEAQTVAYSTEWKHKLEQAFYFSESELDSLNIEYTHFLASVVNQFLLDFSVSGIDAVCSHGHTIKHKPNEGYTLQIGNLPFLANLLNTTVVCDFRIGDVALGGQGAPLVPVGDQLLFQEFDYCLNLGGFSNISTEINAERIAYDICPVNIVFNLLAERMGYRYDEDGKLAQSGFVNNPLLFELNKIGFYQENYPKSLGKEFIEDTIIPVLNKFSISNKDLLRTFLEHAAIQIAEKVKPNSRVLVTGGGAYNSFFIERLNDLKGSVKWEIPSKKIIEFKEALIFGFLGVLRLRNEINVLASVTGAKHNHCSGNIFLTTK